MAHNGTVLGQFLKLVSRHEFEREAGRRHRGRKLRSMSRWSQFAAMATAQLSGRCSLRCQWQPKTAHLWQLKTAHFVRERGGGAGSGRWVGSVRPGSDVGSGATGGRARTRGAAAEPVNDSETAVSWI